MTSINDPIREFQSTMDMLKARAEMLRPLIKSCEEALARSSIKGSISVQQISRVLPQVSITCGVKSLDDMVPLFRELAKEGIRTNKDNPYTDSKLFDVISVRKYHCNDKDIIIIAAPIPDFMNDSDDAPAQKCEAVQVGVKEVPIYEIRCT